MRPTRLTTTLLAATVFGVVLGAAIAAAPAPALAADDEDLPLDSRILRSILEGIGLRRDGAGSGIDYQERAPLVIPPRLDLPQPENTAAAVEKNPAWPKDPDVARRKEATRQARSRNTSKEIEIEQNPLRPNQMTPGAPGGVAPRTASRDDGYRTPANGFDSQVLPSALGYKGGLFSKMFGSEDEVVRFTGEPPRGSLTDPPPGYQTPSPDQPYGLAKSTTNPTPKPSNYLLEHGTSTNPN
ncbi:MAG: hypothetical protein ACK4UO_10410 [Pseudolabrys sp.]